MHNYSAKAINYSSVFDEIMVRVAAAFKKVAERKMTVILLE